MKAQKHFQGFEILHVLRDSNIATDILAKLRSDRVKVPPGVFIEELSAPSIKQPKEITPQISAKGTQILVITTSWTQVFIDYIKENKLPAEKEEATRVVRRSKNYVLVGGKLYREPHHQEYSKKRVSFEEGKEILDEIHSGCYGNHVASRTLVSKAFRTGYYWPTALKDIEELVRRCKGCQMFARQAHVPAHNLICIPPAWPFSC